MRFKNFGKYLFLIILVSIIGFLYSFSKKKNLNRELIKISVDFENTEHHFLNKKMVNKLLIQKIDSIQNQTKTIIDLYILESHVSKDPYVENASVFLTIEGELKSVIKQRNPIARIISNKESYYIDKHGVKLPLTDKYSARVLLVSGIENESQLSKILPLLKIIYEDEFLEKEIVGITKMNNDDYQFSVRSGVHKIHFGKLNQIDIKFKKLKAFYNKALIDKTIKNYKAINLRYNNQVVCIK